MLNHDIKMSLSATRVGFALFAFVTGCGILGQSQGAASSQKELTPQGPLVAAHVSPADANYLQDLTFTGLPAGRYALFLSPSSFSAKAALLAFDVDTKCGAAGDGVHGANGPTAEDAGTSLPSEDHPRCVANDLTGNGAAVSVLVIGVAAASQTVAVSHATHDLFVVLRALDGGSLGPSVSLSAVDLTVGAGDDPYGPSIEPVTLL